MPCYEMFLSQVGHVFQVMFKSSLCKIHGATTTVEYVFTCKIHGATTTVEYVFFMLSQVSDQVHVKSSSVHVSI